MNQYLALSLTATLLFLCSCAPIRLQGSGNVVSETRDVRGFERVEVCCGMHVVLTQGDPEQLTLEGEDNILREIETFVRGETLTVRYRSTTPFPLRLFDLLRTNRPVMVYLQMVNVRGVDISGGATLETERIADERVTLNFSGGQAIRRNPEAARDADHAWRGWTGVKAKSPGLRMCAGSQRLFSPSIKSPALGR